jgi:class 3 adenylate cyclase
MSKDSKSAKGDQVRHEAPIEDPLSSSELGKHLDSILRQNLPILYANELEHLQVTVAFWDISGFSDLCISLNDYPSHIVKFLRKYFGLGVNIIEQYSGVLDKFIGDGILAYFGYPHMGNGNGDPENAISASLEFREKFNQLKLDFIDYCKKNSGKHEVARKINLKMRNSQWISLSPLL